jgi:hypothetical protein
MTEMNWSNCHTEKAFPWGSENECANKTKARELPI